MAGNTKSLNRLQATNLETDVCGYIIQGMSRTEALIKVLEAYPKLSKLNADAVYERAKAAIVDRVAIDAEKVVDLHVRWYERCWQGFEDLGLVPGKLAAMRQKEKILGLLKEENVVKVTNEINVNIGSKTTYDINKLTPEEQSRLDRYLKLVVANG